MFNEEIEKTLDIIVPLEEKKRNWRQNKPWYTSQLLKEKSSETGKEHKLHVERINTGKHLPGNETDTTEC